MMIWNKCKRLILLGICCVALQSKTLAQPPDPPVQEPDYFTGDKVPGDPENEVKIMQRYYQCVQIYRKNHDGNYPQGKNGASFLSDEIEKHPTDYGFAEIKQATYLQDLMMVIRTFVNPDTQYAYGRGNVDTQKVAVIDTQMRRQRQDGTTFNSPKLEGTRDILAQTSLYFHPNWPGLKHIGRPANPVGFYMVLWDDGEIEKIPYDQILYVTVPIKDAPSGFGWQVAFRGEAGLPWDCFTYGELEQAESLSEEKTIPPPPIGFPLAPGQTDAKPDNGGIESLVTLKRLENQQFDREQIWDLLGHQVKDFTLDDIQAAAVKLKFPLQKKTITLDELQNLHTPAILHLNSTWPIVTVPAIDDDYAIVCYNGETLIVPTQKLAAQYEGEALIPSTVAPPLQVDNPVRVLKFDSEDADVTQEVKITNTSTKPVSLSLERPICGVTEANLSSDKIAPGQFVILKLNFEWREFLKGNKQSTFVMIHTDNPSQPVLQLGFQLELTGQ
jgi:hypothetical protein